MTTFSDIFGKYDVVNALAVFDNGDGPALYVGGWFNTVDGMTVNNIARWDGSEWSALGSGVGGTVYTMAVFDDGNGPALYVGGWFSSAGGMPASRIARWDGSTWSPLGSGISGGANVAVQAMTVFDDKCGGGPALYVGGRFTMAGGISASHIARWDGSTWSALGSGINSPHSWLHALAVFDDETGDGPALYVGGEFWEAGDEEAYSIAKWNGEVWSAVGGGIHGMVFGLAVVDDETGAGSSLYAGGHFGVAGDVVANNIARWDGESWSALGSGVGELPHITQVNVLAVYDDGSGCEPSIFVGGSFTTAGDVAASHIAKWRGNAGRWTALGDGLSPDMSLPPRVVGLAIFDDGSGAGPALYVAGDFVAPSGDRLFARWQLCPAAKSIPGDLNGDGVVDVSDLLVLLAAWGPCPTSGDCLADLNNDGVVDVSDLLALLANWG